MASSTASDVEFVSSSNWFITSSGTGGGVDISGACDRTGGLIANEFPFAQQPGAFNGTFFGRTTGMVAQSEKSNGTFRSQLSSSTDMTGQEVWIRAAEVFNNANLPPDVTGFRLGLEDANGTVAWVDSDEVGGLLRPYVRPDSFTKTMLKTMRFPIGCFLAPRKKFDRTQVKAILLGLNRNQPRPIAFDDLEIVKH